MPRAALAARAAAESAPPRPVRPAGSDRGGRGARASDRFGEWNQSARSPAATAPRPGQTRQLGRRRSGRGQRRQAWHGRPQGQSQSIAFPRDARQAPQARARRVRGRGGARRLRAAGLRARVEAGNGAMSAPTAQRVNAASRGVSAGGKEGGGAVGPQRATTAVLQRGPPSRGGEKEGARRPSARRGAPTAVATRFYRNRGARARARALVDVAAQGGRGWLARATAPSEGMRDAGPPTDPALASGAPPPAATRQSQRAPAGDARRRGQFEA